MQQDKQKPLTPEEKKVLDLCREVQRQGWGEVTVIIKDGRITRAKAGKEVKLD